MELKIKRIEISNFKGIKNTTYSFSDLTKIIGANATGKTTIFDAFEWLLHNKDSQGNAKFNIRPLDNNGNQIDNVEINVKGIFEVDGKELELSKTQKQNWVKKRGESEKKFQGNINSFEIDGYPKSESEYGKYINELISDDLFKIITNPTYFPNMNWKEQRSVLTKLAPMSDIEIAREKKEFEAFITELEKADTDSIRKKYEKALKEWKKKCSEIPVRIDELEKQKADIDVAELELGRNALRKEIQNIKAKQEDVEKQYEEYRNLSASVIELKTKQSELERVANLDLVKERNELETQLATVTAKTASERNKISILNQRLQNNKSELYEKNSERNKLLEEVKNVKEREFDENSLICPYCKQEYTTDKKEQLRADFETHKQEEVDSIIVKGKAVRVVIDKLTSDNAELQIKIADLEKNIKVSENEISAIQNKIDDLPNSIDISETEEYKAIQKQINEINEIVDRRFDGNETRQKLKAEEQSLNSQLLEIEKRIAKAEYDVEIDERISELQEKHREISQKQAEQEKMLDLLDEFIRFKMDKISQSINQMFDGIEWKLFDVQINGGVKECCECTVNGVPYKDLNNGHKIVAGLQIIKALQKHYDVSAPIWIDNAESLNDFNLPQMDCQMILLKVSDNKELKVEV